jgi:hypothetical protein
MATRSRIAIEKQDGIVTSIYCHWDGYVKGNGETLQKYYTDPSKVEQLIALGDLSSLGKYIEPLNDSPTVKKHTFNDPHPKVTVAYARDRGEDFSQFEHKDVEDFFSGNYQEYGYLFTKDGRWLVANGGPVVELQLALKEEGVL